MTILTAVAFSIAYWTAVGYLCVRVFRGVIHKLGSPR